MRASLAHLGAPARVCATALFAALGFGFAPRAQAACDAGYDSGILLGDLVMIEEAVRNNDGPTALSVANKMESGFGCLTEPMPYMIVARAYRAVGAGKTLGGDESGGRAWFLTALELDPAFEYGLEDMPADSPLRFTFEGARGDAEIAPTEVEGMDMSEGTHYLDGSLISAPRATLGRPHLYQTDIGGFHSQIIQGNTFPESALAAEAAVVVAEVVEEKPKKEPKEPKEPKEEKEKPAKNPTENVDDGGFYQRSRPPEKTPLIIAGGVTIAGSGVLYYMSSRARKKFDEAETKDDLDKYKGQTNRLVLSAGIVGAVGVGVLTWGIILDDTGRPLPGFNIRW